MSKPHDAELLGHMIESCRKIQDRVGLRNVAELQADDVLLDSILRQIENLGEAARLLSESTRAAYPEIPWASIIAMRNRVSHVYWGVDVKIVWDVAATEIPALLRKLKSASRGR